MKVSRRTALAVTAGGLIHVAAHPQSLAGRPVEPTEVLLRRAAERGHTDLGWLRSDHSFSFGNYYDERHLGFRSLRVINDDRVGAGRGFPTHPHRNMEILSYVLEGALQHKDSTGRGALITSDVIQIMSAGRGITHSEFNPSSSEENHFLQIWIEPAIRGTRPQYLDQKVTTEQKRHRWNRIAGPAGSQAAVTIRQDASIFATNLLPEETLDYTVQRSRHVWLQVARGSLVVNGTHLRSGDAIASSRANQLHIEAIEPTEALLFDLA